MADVRDVLCEGGDALYRIDYHYVQGTEMHGIIVGGNIRCFLKLSGTAYMPDLNGKILLLESRSGTVARMETYLSQLQQIGAFEQIAGILLGTFTEMEAKQCMPDIVQLVKKYVRKTMPMCRSRSRSIRWLPDSLEKPTMPRQNALRDYRGSVGKPW